MEERQLYQSIVIGAGIAGAVVARELAEQGGQKVLVIEKRNHIGGNCYDLEDEYGVLVHQYGPHIFHTDYEEVYAYLSKFTKWHHFKHQVVANVYGKQISVPFNLNTLHQVYEEEKAVELEKRLIEEYGYHSRVPILKLKEHNDSEIQGISDFVYENIFLHYTMKQWGKKPEEIDPGVTARVPVVISHDDGYFSDKYQGMPLEGYTNMFQRILDHPNIEVKMKTDARDLLKLEEDKVYYQGEEFQGNVIYTGAVDELYHYEYGALPYRSLEFYFEHHKEDDYQGHAVVNYTVNEDYTRITEFKHLTGQEVRETTIVKEYPVAYEEVEKQIPYYAVQSEESQRLYKEYEKKVNRISNFHLLGRLAEYKYYDIDDMVEKALRLSERLLKK